MYSNVNVTQQALTNNLTNNLTQQAAQALQSIGHENILRLRDVNSQIAEIRARLFGEQASSVPTSANAPPEPTPSVALSLDVQNQLIREVIESLGSILARL